MQPITRDAGKVEAIRARKNAVLVSWQREVLREIAALAHLSERLLVDPVGIVVDRITDWLIGAPDRVESLAHAVEAHTVQRFRHGFPIDSVVHEYARLRRCMREVADVSLGAQLDDALDAATACATKRYLLQREELRDRFIGVLAHDLRSPLACVTMASEIMLAGERTPRERTILELVLDSADRMQRMVNDVLAWARESAGDMFPIHTSTQDMAAILSQVAQETQLAHGEHAITLDTSGDLRGLFDRDRIHQVITNLVRNAIEHGSGTAHVEAHEADEGETIILVVRNRGALRASSISDITDPFRRRKRPSNARGLGLYIVDQIARAHGATVEMTAMDEDTAITIRWPTRRRRLTIEPHANV